MVKGIKTQDPKDPLKYKLRAICFKTSGVVIYSKSKRVHGLPQAANSSSHS
jgi:hypothetical protein